MAGSKKVLVAFDPNKPNHPSSDFLIPVRSESSKMELLGTRSGKIISYGSVILTNRAVTENDLFAKLVDTGQRVPNVEDTLAEFARFLEAIKSLKIGNVVKVESSLEDAFKLAVISSTPTGFGRRDSS